MGSLVPPKAEAADTSRVMKAAVIGYYMASSILTQSATKSILTVFDFNFPVTLCLAQMAFTAPVCGIISGSGFDIATVISLIPLAMVNCANIVSGLFGTGGLSVPMFIVLRRFTMVLTMLLEYQFFGQSHDWQTLGSVGVMILGAIVAAATDLSFNFYGYASALMNDLFTAAYLVMVKHFGAARHLDTTTLLYYNALISMIPLLASSFATGEMARLQDYPMFSSPYFHVALLFAVCLGLTISHSTYLCTRVNEPLTTSVAGSIKNIVMTGIGMVSFGDYVLESRNLIGIGISMVGAVWYTIHMATKKAAPPH